MATNNAWNSQDPAQVSKGGTGLATLTDGAFMIGNGTDAVEMLGPPSKGDLVVGDGTTTPQFLTVGADDTMPIADSSEILGVRWGTPIPASAGGAWVWLNSQSASTSATIEWDNTYINSTYNHYHITIRNMIPVTDNTFLKMLLSNDNGSTFEVTNYKSRINLLDSITTGSSIPLSKQSGTTGIGTAADEGRYTAEIDLYQPADASEFTVVKSHFGYTSANGGTQYHGLLISHYVVAEAIDAVQFSLNTDEISSGEFILYAIQEA